MNSVPLTDVLPWGDEPPSGGRTVLVLDSAEMNGRFLLHTLASQCLSSKFKSLKSKLHRSSNSNSNISQSSSSASSLWNIIWISCGTTTEEQVFAAMKKIGCDLRSNADRVEVLPITYQLAQQYGAELDSKDEDSNADADVSFNSEECLKRVYQRVRDKMSKVPKCMILLDDVTSLSTFFGSTLTYAFVQKIRYLVRKQSQLRNKDCDRDASFVMVASHDMDQEYYINSTNQQEQVMSVAGGKRSQQIGAEQMMMTAMSCNHEVDDSEEYVWERALVELADGVVDVTPLASGFARDVHGRLVFTERMGGGLGWRCRRRKDANSTGSNRVTKLSGSFSTSVVNYCCSDAGVRAIRLRVGS